MAHDCRITHALMDRQRDMFRVACDPLRYGNTLARISSASGIPYSTIRGYAAGTAEMPLSALHKLADCIPAELLSLLAPAGRIIVRVPEELDHDTLAELAQDYLRDKSHAHHPESPGGRDIAPCEDEELSAKAMRLKVAA